MRGRALIAGLGAVLAVSVALSAGNDQEAHRFAFWGAEELGLVGSTAYVDGLTLRQRGQLRAVLNFDMLGSRNYGRFVYDGNGAPPGSQAIENAFRSYFAVHKLPVDQLSLGGSSDHAPFARAGIAVGGLFTGADEPKTAGDAARFGGTAGVPLDACYHQACDTVANVDFRILGQMADAAAVVALRLAG